MCTQCICVCANTRVGDQLASGNDASWDHMPHLVNHYHQLTKYGDTGIPGVLLTYLSIHKWGCILHGTPLLTMAFVAQTNVSSVNVGCVGQSAITETDAAYPTPPNRQRFGASSADLQTDRYRYAWVSFLFSDTVGPI